MRWNAPAIGPKKGPEPVSDDNEFEGDADLTDEEAQALEEENLEGLIFAKIIRHIAEQMTSAPPPEGSSDDDLQNTAGLFLELADAFEAVGGFEFAAEQALPLSHAFVLIEQGMRALSAQAREGGHDNAAAKMEWAAGRARLMTAKLEERHLAGAGGIVAFGNIDDDLSVH